MSLAAILEQEMDNTYAVTKRLFSLVEPGQLCWKPPTGRNWMTVAQLLAHCASSCGAGFRGFVSGDWGLPAGVEMKDLPPDAMLPPAEKLPAVSSVEEALRLLEEDRALAERTLADVDENALLAERSSAPWGGADLTLFQHLMHMIEHLGQHKGQLFYYLKLLDKDINTGDLWGNV